jgi:hypothetical protein
MVAWRGAPNYPATGSRLLSFSRCFFGISFANWCGCILINWRLKQTAIIQYNGYEWNGKSLKVERIMDIPGRNRVLVPERMVSYVIGAVKKTRSGKPSTLRRISRDDVERLSRGQPSKKKGYGSRNVPHRLNDDERREMDRAAKKGYLELAGSGNRRTRKGSPLANIHRQWCDARDKPQILLFKAVSGRPEDELVIDLSPLRLNGLYDDAKQAEEFFVKLKTEILSAAASAGMELRSDDNADDEESAEPVQDDENLSEYVLTLGEISQEAWASQPIWKLPMVSIGSFEGERAKAKAMARELAILWEVPEDTVGDGPKTRRVAGAKGGGKTKMGGLSSHRKTRGGGHRQAY